MTFSARKTLDDLNLEPFPFEGLDGKLYELPHLLSLEWDLVERFETMGLREIINDIAPDAIEAITNLPIGVLAKLTDAWKAEAEAKAGSGESPASPPSSESTARPSKPTLRSGASTTRKR